MIVSRGGSVVAVGPCSWLFGGLSYLFVLSAQALQHLVLVGSASARVVSTHRIRAIITIGIEGSGTRTASRAGICPGKLLS